MERIRIRKDNRRRIGGPNNKCAGSKNKGNIGGDQKETEMRSNHNHIKPHKRSINKSKYGVCEGVKKRKKSPLGENERTRIKLGLTPKPNPRDPIGIRNGRRVRSDSRVTRRIHSAPPKVRSDRHRRRPRPVQEESSQESPVTPQIVSSSNRGNTPQFTDDGASRGSVHRPKSITPRRSTSRVRSIRSISNSSSNARISERGEIQKVLFETSAEKRKRTGKQAMVPSSISTSPPVSRPDGSGPSRLRSPKPKTPANKISPRRKNVRGLVSKNYAKIANAGISPKKKRTDKPRAPPKIVPKMTIDKNRVVNDSVAKFAAERIRRMKLGRIYEKKEREKERRMQLKFKRKYNPTPATRKSSRNK